MPTTSESRETRTHAQEVKFLVPRAMATEIRHWATRHLLADRYGSGPHGDEYRTTSLYFDTPDRDVFHRRRSFARAKYRVRRYGHMPVVFLERKMRTSRMLAKRRTIVPAHDLSRLVSERLDDSWAGAWFHDRVRLRQLVPTCQIAYRRIARIGVSDLGPFRLTIDDELRAQSITRTAFADDRGLQILSQREIVELKFTGSMPPIFDLLVSHFALERVAISKYRVATCALNGLPLPAEIEACLGAAGHADSAGAEAPALHPEGVGIGTID